MRIEPTHFIEVWKTPLAIKPLKRPKAFHFLDSSLGATKGVPTAKTVALFLIREKTPSEKANWQSRVKELTDQHLTNTINKQDNDARRN